MNAAEITLLTAMTRARLSAARPALHRGERRHDEEAAADRDADEFQQDDEALGGRREGEPVDVVALDDADQAPGEREAADAHDDAAERHERQIGAHMAQRAREQRADRDADREHQHAQRVDVLRAADDLRDDRRQQRQRHGAGEPEPGDDQRAVPDALVGLGVADQRERGGPGVARDDEVGRGRGRTTEWSARRASRRWRSP